MHSYAGVVISFMEVSKKTQGNVCVEVQNKWERLCKLGQRDRIGGDVLRCLRHKFAFQLSIWALNLDMSIFCS